MMYVQISGLPSSSTLNAADVFAKDSNLGTTEKINAQDLTLGVGALGGFASSGDLASIKASGTTNQTGATITAETYFYLNSVLVRAKTDIGSGATFTSGTNYDAVSEGALNSLTKQEEQILHGNVEKNSTLSIAPSAEGAHMLMLSRRNNSCFIMVAFDFWTQGYTTISGSAISGVTITKNALTNVITVANTLGYSLAYSCF